MSIKEILEKITNIFKGNNKKMLPEVARNEIEEYGAGNKGSSREEFIAGVKRENVENQQIDMEQDFLDLIEGYNKEAKEESILLAKMFLTSEGVEFTQEDDVEQIKEETIKKRAEEKNIPLGLANEIANISQNKYIEEAFTTFVEAKGRSNNGENLALSKREKVQIEYIEKLIQTESRLSELQGNMTGIMHAAYMHSLTNEQNNERKTGIEKNMEETKKIASLFKYKGQQKGLEIKGVTNIDRILFISDKAQESLTGFLNYRIFDSYEKAFSKYDGYLNHGGTSPDLDIFEKNKVRKTEFEMTDKQSEELVSEANKLIEEGRIDIQNER